MMYRIVLQIMLMMLTVALCNAAGVLSGRVVDADDGSAINGATITISGVNRGTSSDSDGRFRLEAVADGNYTVVISHIAYQPRTIRQLPISTFQNPHLLLELELHVWQSDSLQVTVSGSSIVIESGRPLFRQQLPSAADTETRLRKLEEIPGVRLQRGSGDGTVILLDGCPAEQVLVCVDGVPLNPGGSASVDLATVPLADASRVEVVRGAGQTLFGGTGGGVVNFVTLDDPTMDNSYYSMSSLPAVKAGLSGNHTRWSYNSGGSYSSGRYPFHDPAAGGRLVRQRNGDKLHCESAVSWNHQQLKMRSAVSAGERGLPPLIDEPGDTRLRQSNLQLSVSGTWTGKRQNLRLYGNANRVAYDAPATANSPLSIATSYLQLDSGLGWELDLPYSNLFLAAVNNEYRFNDEIGTVPKNRGSRRQLRGGGALEIPAFANFPALEIKAGAAAVLTPRCKLNPFVGISTVSQLGQGQFHLGLEQGLHYPAFATQFPLEAFQVRGNPDLLPERFLELRAGWLQSGDRLTWQLEYSHKLSRDLIRWQRGNGNVYRPVNLDRALIQSLTGYFRYQLKPQATCSGSLQLQDPRNRTAGDINEGLILPLRQLLAGYLRVSLDRAEYFGDITLQYGSRQYTLAANTSHLSLGFRDLDPYTLTSASLGRKLSVWELVLRVDNIFNQDLQRLERRVEPLRTFNFLVQRKF